MGAAKVLYRSMAQPKINDGKITKTAHMGGCDRKCKPAKSKLVTRFATLIGRQAI